MFDFLVVGAGFAGSVVAERLARAGASVHIIERRLHIAGNAYDEFDSHGLLVHRYGPHIFHTNSARVVDYLSQFTDWRPYEYRVRACVDGRLVPFPVNRTTLNMLYGLDLDEAGAKVFLERARLPRNPILTSEDVVLNAVGRDLYEKFFQGYTRKQWGLDPSELSAAVCGRIRFHAGADDRYFSDKFQAMPRDGYTRMFERILDQPGISYELGVEFGGGRDRVQAGHTFYTGPIDAYFDCRLGRLPYRSLRFEHEHLAGVRWLQPVATVSYPNCFSFTRATEFKHLTGQDHPGTSIVREYPQSAGEPYYPILTPANIRLYKRYEELARAEKNVTFVGRLAQYRYLNMDQAVAAALTAADAVLAGELARA
ncbi:MAG TPA: UDP-galactopyranose mutase [Patescibacteria group bacterium]|nr:UDP-galactopyranose mutase [Patescibacteria group bacterium]